MMDEIDKSFAECERQVNENEVDLPNSFTHHEDRQVL